MSLAGEPLCQQATFYCLREIAAQPCAGRPVQLQAGGGDARCL